jgi:catechol 2,3-dioxygenase-like lactoylglutathione lyase family enzyme
MKRTWTIIGVDDVAASFKWYQSLFGQSEVSPGNGLLLLFRVDDFGASLQRARALGTPFEEQPHVNPDTGTCEFLAPGPGWVLRHDQCTLAGLTIVPS